MGEKNFTYTLTRVVESISTDIGVWVKISNLHKLHALYKQGCVKVSTGILRYGKRVEFGATLK